MQTIPRKALSRILIVDDEENVRHMLAMVLGRAGYETSAASSVDEALALLAEQPHDVVLTDLRMPRRSGLELVEALTSPGSAQPYIILMTAYGSMDVALEAMSRGAYDYISKPFKPDEILLTLRKIEEREGLLRENRRLKAQVESGAISGLIGRSPPMAHIGRLVKRFAPHKTTVLLTGESGTGKDVVARALHELSERRERPFVAVNCAAIPEALLESELFGHTRGAFTGAVRNKPGLFEEASGGTLFLDEIGDLPLSLQSKLLRAIEAEEIRPVGSTTSMSVDARIVCATARDLEARVAQGAFREDLFYRINILAVKLPPLRDRKGDIPELVEHFIRRSAARAGKDVGGITREALRRLMDHSWPGNVRELEHAIERAVILCDGDTLEVGDLSVATVEGEMMVDGESLSIKEGTRRLEARLIARALEETGGNRTQAAALLEISHRTLLYKLKEYGLDGRA